VSVCLLNMTMSSVCVCVSVCLCPLNTTMSSVCVCVSVEHDHELCARMTEAMEMQFGGLLEWTQRTVYSVEARINSGGRGVFFSGVGGFPGTLKT